MFKMILVAFALGGLSATALADGVNKPMASASGSADASSSPTRKPYVKRANRAKKAASSASAASAM